MCSDAPARFVAVDFFRSEPGGVLYTPRGRPGVAPRAGFAAAKTTIKCDGRGGVWGGGTAQRSACMVVRRVRRPSGRGVQSRERRWGPDACMGFLQHRELLQLQRFWAGAAAQPLLPFVPPAMIDVAPGRRDMDKVIALHDSLNFPDNGALQPVPYAGCRDYGPRRFKRADHCFVCEEFFGAFDDPARFAQRAVGDGEAAGAAGTAV